MGSEPWSCFKISTSGVKRSPLTSSAISFSLWSGLFHPLCLQQASEHRAAHKYIMWSFATVVTSRQFHVNTCSAALYDCKWSSRWSSWVLWVLNHFLLTHITTISCDPKSHFSLRLLQAPDWASLNVFLWLTWSAGLPRPPCCCTLVVQYYSIQPPGPRHPPAEA